MSREIKFRAWDGSRILRVYDLNCAGEESVLIDGQNVMTIANDRLEFMQYTGLSDKNGVEIYEGNIVKHFFNGEWFTNEVSFKRGAFMLGNYQLGYAVDGEMAGAVTIIGNVYQNKELLA